MAYSDFVALYALDNQRSPEDLLAEQPLRFALTANDRGAALSQSLQSWLKYDFAKKRVLDVGCAYGGLSLALANAGAQVTGIDPNPKLISYAEANAYGEADVALSVLDIANVSVRQKFSEHSFDFIILNDTLERAYDTDALISNVDYLLSEQGLIYFRIPNNNSTRYILSEGRTKAFGLLLLDPDCWFYHEQRRASAFYRSLNSYLALFQFYGMPQRIMIDDENVLGRITEPRLSRQIKEIFNTARTTDFPHSALTPLMRKQTVKLRDRYIYDREQSGDDFVKFKYGSAYFSGFVGRPDAALSLCSPIIDLPEFGTIGRSSNGQKSADDSNSDGSALPLQMSS